MVRSWKGEMVGKEKLKLPYEASALEVVLFEFSDIITTSNPTSGPSKDDVNDGSWLTP